MLFGKVEDCIFALHRAVLDDQHHNAFLEKVARVDVGEVAILQNNEQLRGPREEPCYMRKTTLKIDRYCLLVM